MPPVLLSRSLDTALGLFTGVFAYYLYETHPRTALPQDQKLTELLRWKWAKYQDERTRKLQALNASVDA